jgi:hypothetical protein
MNPQKLLEAHVRFELDRWSGSALTATVESEVVALFEWFTTVRVSELVDAEGAIAVARRVAAAALSDPAVRAATADLVRDALEAALDDDLTLADVVPRDAYDRLVAVAVSLDGLREDVIRQVTTSDAYSELLSHVLYHGLKSYVLTENVVARRVPGASSLVRLGQSAMKTAAPRLEQGIDRQLTAFVNANISDTIRESRRYLDSALDEDVLRAIADEVWDSNAGRTAAEVRALLPEESAGDAFDAMADLVGQLLETEPGASLIDAAARGWLERNADRPVADVLADVGVSTETVLPDLLVLIGPAIETALTTGFLEQRIRARLEPFYASL